MLQGQGNASAGMIVRSKKLYWTYEKWKWRKLKLGYIKYIQEIWKLIYIEVRIAVKIMWTSTAINIIY